MVTSGNKPSPGTASGEKEPVEVVVVVVVVGLIEQHHVVVCDGQVVHHADNAKHVVSNHCSGVSTTPSRKHCNSTNSSMTVATKSPPCTIPAAVVDVDLKV